MSLKKNIFANFMGSAWSALMGIAFIPFYIRIMGVESYGIVGVFSSLLGLLAFLDLGLSQTMNREMARLASEEQNFRRMADTAYTLELVYWGIALLVGASVVFLARPIAQYWLNPEHLNREEVQQAVSIMGLVIALRWPVALYIGGLNGLQRQVHLNVILIITATMQGLGALLALWFISSTIKTFFIWQALVALAQTVTLRIVLWRYLSCEVSARFNKAVLKEIWHFAAGMTGISLLATMLTQLDKLILSKVLSLSEFGYYTFAATVAAVMFRLINPVFTAYYPRLTEIAAKQNQAGLAKLYHQGSQLMAVVIFPSAFILTFFSNEILELWTQDSNIVLHASLLLSLLSIGNTLNGLMYMPYALQLAHGWTKLAFVQNVVAVVLMVPAIYLATGRWGAIGAANMWIALNIGYILISIHVVHRRFLPDEKWTWYFSDVIKPLVVVLSLGLIFRCNIQANLKLGWGLVLLFTTLVVTTVAAIVTSNALCARFSIRKIFMGNR